LTLTPQSISPVIQPLYDELCGQLAEAGLTPAGPSIAYYEDSPDGGVIVHAAFPGQRRAQRQSGFSTTASCTWTAARTRISG
jgi:hypothetical protein